MIKNCYTKVISMIKHVYSLDGADNSPTYPMENPFLVHQTYSDLDEFPPIKCLIIPSDIYYKY